MDNEEGAVSEHRGVCVKHVIGVDESPNPVVEGGAVRPQRVVVLLLGEVYEFLHAIFVEKQRLVRIDLQDCGEFEPKPLDKNRQQKDRFS